MPCFLFVFRYNKREFTGGRNGQKSYDNGTDFSFVEQKVREVQTTIENAVKTSNYQELNQSITKMVNNTLKQYQKEHPTTVQKKLSTKL